MSGDLTARNYTIGYFVGSLSAESINRALAKALIRLAPDSLTFVEIPIKDLPLYSPNLDADDVVGSHSRWRNSHSDGGGMADPPQT
jgi:NAD(P)H-dependent FMN reductase